MNAHRLFKKGARVCITVEYQHMWRSLHHRVGTVIGFSRDARYVWVRWDGNKTAYSTFVGFLTSEENAIREAVPPSEPVARGF